MINQCVLEKHVTWPTVAKGLLSHNLRLGLGLHFTTKHATKLHCLGKIVGFKDPEPSFCLCYCCCYSCVPTLVDMTCYEKRYPVFSGQLSTRPPTRTMPSESVYGLNVLNSPFLRRSLKLFWFSLIQWSSAFCNSWGDRGPSLGFMWFSSGCVLLWHRARRFQISLNV